MQRSLYSRSKPCNAGIAYNLQAITGLPHEAAAEISAAARLCDLPIVLQPEHDRVTFDNTLPREILRRSISCGRSGAAIK